MLVLPTRGRSNKRAWAIRHVPNCIAQLLLLILPTAALAAAS
jgi:hypothetical protein